MKRIVTLTIAIAAVVSLYQLADAARNARSVAYCQQYNQANEPTGVPTEWLLETKTETPESTGTLTSEEQNFMQAFADFRARHGLATPMLDGSLVNNSRRYSERMRQTRRFAHDSNRNDGTGENIYVGSGSGMAAFRAWERSPGHRALMLKPNIQTFGVGNDGNYWTFRARSRVRGNTSAPQMRQSTPQSNYKEMTTQVMNPTRQSQNDVYEQWSANYVTCAYTDEQAASPAAEPQYQTRKKVRRGFLRRLFNR